MKLRVKIKDLEKYQKMADLVITDTNLENYSGGRIYQVQDWHNHTTHKFVMFEPYETEDVVSKAVGVIL